MILPGPRPFAADQQDRPQIHTLRNGPPRCMLNYRWPTTITLDVHYGFLPEGGR